MREVITSRMRKRRSLSPSVPDASGSQIASHSRIEFVRRYASGSKTSTAELAWHFWAPFGTMEGRVSSTGAGFSMPELADLGSILIGTRVASKTQWEKALAAGEQTGGEVEGLLVAIRVL